MATVKEVTSFEDFKVQVVTSNPDILVYVTKWKSEADNSDFIWYIDNYFPKRKYKIVNSSPDLKVQYVNSKGSAGWKISNHKLRNKIA